MGNKTCGNCKAAEAFNDTHVTCKNPDCRSCGCLKSKTSGGCKCWKEAAR